MYDRINYFGTVVITDPEAAIATERESSVTGFKGEAAIDGAIETLSSGGGGGDDGVFCLLLGLTSNFSNSLSLCFGFVFNFCAIV